MKLACANVSKHYGKTAAIDGFSMSITEAGIYCLLGRNGAGKTTFLKLLSGQTAATSGSVTVNSRTVAPLAMPEEVYFVASDAQQFNLPLQELYKAAADINPAFDIGFAMEMSRRFNLDQKKRFKSLSFGMKAMANTLIALASGREVLLLDEPVLGFDPIMRKTFYEMLQESAQQSSVQQSAQDSGGAEKKRTVIVSTHIIDEIARVAERLIIIEKGRPLLFCGMEEIDEKAYSVTGPADAVRAVTKGLNVIAETKAGGFISHSVYDRRIEESGGYSIAPLGLQDFFVGLVGDTTREAIV
ncbi:ABC transporter ATP-binding protein [Spirochaetia bacterium]|nr:ABC transporter ATP-binding protein [Spirochaetia bacterium]